MTTFHSVIWNFEKNVILLTKDFFSRSFQSFYERVSCVKNVQPKGIRSNQVRF